MPNLLERFRFAAEDALTVAKAYETELVMKNKRIDELERQFAFCQSNNGDFFFD
jgi:hypothetical protein